MSSCRAIDTDILDPLLPPVPIVHRFRKVFRDTPRIYTELRYEEVHRSTSLMSSSLLLQQCLACLVRLILIVFMMVVCRPYSCYFVGCCLQDLFNIVRSIPVQLPLSFLSICLVQHLCSASIQQYRHDCCQEETAFHFIGQV